MTYNNSVNDHKQNSSEPNSTEIRNTDQFVMPAQHSINKENGYDIYPSFKTSESIFRGYDSLAQHIIDLGENVILDGYGGVQWKNVRKAITEYFHSKGIQATWIPIESCLRSVEEVDKMIAPFLDGDDPLFGKVFTGEIADFFDSDKIAALKPDANGFTILYGSGAALANWKCPIIYFDLPKNEIQFRSRAGKVINLGAENPIEPKAQYKRFYFVDWIVYNKHKQLLLPHLEVIVDEQRLDDITWMSGENLRNSLGKLSSTAFRARPWFEPGVWGGQWIKNNIDQLNKDVVNYAWSFEFIAPENGLILEHDGIRLEISIDTLLYHNNEAILGKAAKRFGYKFPIRFDFLDTIDGDNLSLQCHPSVAYTKTHFGEDFTQDETYYILETAADAEVYLGFQEQIDPKEFKTVLEDSFKTGTLVQVEQYVQVFPAKKHDLFLIPNGTVHCSGKNNMVLEISATPYIFTFKMYDWVRPDLSGKPRTLNIDRAFANLDFERKGKVVSDTLLSKSTVIKKGTDWELINLSTHPEHFYAIERVEFDTVFTDDTNDHCLVLSLVEGASITLKTGDLEQVIHYAETFIIPANAHTFTMKNNGPGRAKVIKSYVKDECC